MRKLRLGQVKQQAHDHTGNKWQSRAALLSLCSISLKWLPRIFLLCPFVWLTFHVSNRVQLKRHFLHDLSSSKYDVDASPIPIHHSSSPMVVLIDCIITLFDCLNLTLYCKPYECKDWAIFLTIKFLSIAYRRYHLFKEWKNYEKMRNTILLIS